MKATLSILLFLSFCGLSISLFRKHLHVNTKLSWEDAQKYCRMHHDDLSTLTFEEAKRAIKHTDVTYYFIWVGFYQNPSNALKWFWSGGENDPAFWDYGEPNFIEVERCGAVGIYTYLLYNVNCNWGLTFFCMEMFELILVNKTETWEDALDYCRQNYIDLVSITSKNITTDVETNTMTAQTPHVWTGLRFLAGHWFWVSGDEYDAWSQNVDLQCPARNLRCAALDTTLKVLKPQDCEERLSFFCIKRKTKNAM